MSIVINREATVFVKLCSFLRYLGFHQDEGAMIVWCFCWPLATLPQCFIKEWNMAPVHSECAPQLLLAEERREESKPPWNVESTRPQLCSKVQTDGQSASTLNPVSSCVDFMGQLFHSRHFYTLHLHELLLWKLCSETILCAPAITILKMIACDILLCARVLDKSWIRIITGICIALTSWEHLTQL